MTKSVTAADLSSLFSPPQAPCQLCDHHHHHHFNITMPRYTHKRAPAAHTSSIQFDAGVSDRKPTAAKSAGTLGKWGVTSFTSIRSSIVNGEWRGVWGGGEGTGL